MTRTQQESQFAMWCILAAPLMLSCDLTTISSDVLAIVTNPEMIAINQDSGCKQGIRISQKPGVGGNLEVWVKPLGTNEESMAVALFNRSSQPARISFTQDDVGLGSHNVVSVRDAWNQRDAGTFRGTFEANVRPHATSVFVLTGGAVPKLQITRSEQQIIVSWPTNDPSLHLQTKIGLSPSAPWIPFQSPPSIVDSEFVVTNLVDDSTKLFRLSQPQPPR